MSDALKPLLDCPFCGGSATMVDAVEAGPNAYCISCNVCGASSGVTFPDKVDPLPHLAFLWNRRAPSEAEAKLARLREIVKPLVELHHKYESGSVEAERALDYGLYDALPLIAQELLSDNADKA